MSYTPTEWKTGDIITAEKLNNMEGGIANAGGGGSSGGVAVYTFTFKDATTSDMPPGMKMLEVEETDAPAPSVIKASLEAGSICFAKYREHIYDDDSGTWFYGGWYFLPYNEIVNYDNNVDARGFYTNNPAYNITIQGNVNDEETPWLAVVSPLSSQ